MTERPEGLDGLLNYVADRMDPIEAVRQLHAAMNDEDFAKLVFRGDVVRQLMARLDHYEKLLPSWAHGTPEDVDRWLHSIGSIPEDKLLRFYQWIGAHAVREVVAGIRQAWDYEIGDGETANSIADMYDPDKQADLVPSVLPLGHPFCDVPHHTHISGSRSPSCRLDAEE